MSFFPWRTKRMTTALHISLKHPSKTKISKAKLRTAFIMKVSNIFTSALLLFSGVNAFPFMRKSYDDVAINQHPDSRSKFETTAKAVACGTAMDGSGRCEWGTSA